MCLTGILSNSSRLDFRVVIFCSAEDFKKLYADISGKANLLRLQAKGGSMYPFIKSGDWVEVELLPDKRYDLDKGDIVLFSKDGSLYAHRIIRKAARRFLTKGDFSFGNDGAIHESDCLAKVKFVVRGQRRIDLSAFHNRIIGVFLATFWFFLRYFFLILKEAESAVRLLFLWPQRLAWYRSFIKNTFKRETFIRLAQAEDVESLKDLYLGSSSEIKEGILKNQEEGFWLVAENLAKIVGALTISPDEKDRTVWLIFGLEVKDFYRGRGIGKKLVRVAIEKAREYGAREIGLFVNKRSYPAVGLYKKCGFKSSTSFPSSFNVQSDESYMKLEPVEASEIDLTVSIVNWNVKDYLGKCLESIFRYVPGIDLEVFVVDNASHDGSVEMVRERFPQVKVIENRENRGFGCAHNQVIPLAQGRYILFLNPDTEMLPDTLPKMLAFMDAHPEAGGCGLREISKAESRDEKEVVVMPRGIYIRYKMCQLLYKILHFRSLAEYCLHLMVKIKQNDYSAYQAKKIAYYEGGFILIRKEALDQSGEFDPKYFLAGEGVDLTSRIKKIGWEIFLVSAVRMIHHGNRSFDQLSPAALQELENDWLKKTGGRNEQRKI